MASGAAALKAAAAIAVFSMLVMSSQGDPKTGPPCSYCEFQCNITSGTVAATNCSSACSYNPECYTCLHLAITAYGECFSNETIYNSVSCCANGCYGSYMTCGPCDFRTVLRACCMDVCNFNNSTCETCKDAVPSSTCNTDCSRDCSKTCVKNDKGW
ncbi:unnamed protein product [Urochloa decumbens]|uniref:Uncharacterized protein n=1 Tax=Urochloa decumbens TaxID=240449 RepID=A0ABC9FRK0_9POAL